LLTCLRGVGAGAVGKGVDAVREDREHGWDAGF